MAFQGSLAELHLPDIIQLVSVSGKTGVFHLTDGVLKGQIYLNDGKIVHAQLEDTSGEEAVYALAIWRQGEFRFDPGMATELRTITKSNTNLLMEAARRLDEWRVLSKKIPSVDLVPEFVVQENREGQINLNTSEWLILSKIDGQRSVRVHRRSASPLGLRRGQDALRPHRHQPDPAAGAGGRPLPPRDPGRPRPHRRSWARPPAASPPPSPGARCRPHRQAHAHPRRVHALLGPVGETRREQALPEGPHRARAGRGGGGDRRRGDTRSRAPPPSSRDRRSPTRSWSSSRDCVRHRTRGAAIMWAMAFDARGVGCAAGADCLAHHGRQPQRTSRLRGGRGRRRPPPSPHDPGRPARDRELRRWGSSSTAWTSDRERRREGSSAIASAKSSPGSAATRRRRPGPTARAWRSSPAARPSPSTCASSTMRSPSVSWCRAVGRRVPDAASGLPPARGQHGLLPRRPRPLRGPVRAAPRRGGPAGRVGRASAHVPSAGRRRLRARSPKPGCATTRE